MGWAGRRLCACTRRSADRPGSPAPAPQAPARELEPSSLSATHAPASAVVVESHSHGAYCTVAFVTGIESDSPSYVHDSAVGVESDSPSVALPHALVAGIEFISPSVAHAHTRERGFESNSPSPQHAIQPCCHGGIYLRPSAEA